MAPRKLSYVDLEAAYRHDHEENLLLTWTVQDLLSQKPWQFEESVRFEDEVVTLRLNRAAAPHGGVVVIEHRIADQSPFITVRYLESVSPAHDLVHEAWPAFSRLRSKAFHIAQAAPQSSPTPDAASGLIQALNANQAESPACPLDSLGPENLHRLASASGGDQGLLQAWINGSWDTGREGSWPTETE